MTILCLLIAWCALSSVLALIAAAFFRVGHGPDPAWTGSVTAIGSATGRNAASQVATLV